MRTVRPRARRRFSSFFAADQGVGGVHGAVELLVRLARRRRRHGQRVVQVSQGRGQLTLLELGAGIEHGFRYNFDSFLRLLHKS